MKYSKKRIAPALSLGIALIAVAIATPQTTNAQKLNQPGGWSSYGWATDNFNDTSVGWQWKVVAKNERSKWKNGAQTWSRFRNQNIYMTGSALRVINWFHNTPVNEGGVTFRHSGGWMESKATWLTEGQFQARTKVDWTSADVWPTFWLIATHPTEDELDIMQYQSDILDVAHVRHHATGGKQVRKREWTPWMQNKWEHDWAMARVTSWTHWASRATRNTNAKFYINAKQEWTSPLLPVTTGMHMLFTSSPHKDHLPGAGSLPNLQVDWVETHIP